MTKSTLTYWNPLCPESQGHWTPVTGMEGYIEELTLSLDPVTGEYTRLTRFLPGADTTAFGGKVHAYPLSTDMNLGFWYEIHVWNTTREGKEVDETGNIHHPFHLTD